MFERYTEKARRVIFFARYEASQLGSPQIETEHLLLGLLREDKALAGRFLGGPASVEPIRKQIEAHAPAREKASGAADLPLSEEARRALNYAAEEAERLSHAQIGTEHLLLGLLREENCFAADILHERALSLATLREKIARPPAEERSANRPRETSLLAEFSRDLTRDATQDQLDPFIGRQRELEQVVRILCRRTRSNPVLIGETGVGKAALVKGLALRIAEGDVPSPLGEKRILALDLSALMAGSGPTNRLEDRLRGVVRELMETRDAILFIEELFALGGARGSLEAADILKPALSHGDIQSIGASTPVDYGRSVEREPWLERSFQPVNVTPPSEAEAVQILLGIKNRYERFHGVAYTEEALQCAVTLSQRYLPDRYLPDKAIDLIDEAGACVKLRQNALPEEAITLQKRIRFIVQRMETSIANHEFEKARFYSEEERKERENLRQISEKYKISELVLSVTPEDIEEVLARWTGLPIKDEEAGSP